MDQSLRDTIKDPNQSHYGSTPPLLTYTRYSTGFGCDSLVELKFEVLESVKEAVSKSQRSSPQ